MQNPDLKILLNKLNGQARKARHYRNYYIGDQPLTYSHERLKNVFKRSQVNFVQNWCSVVIDTTLDRLDLRGFDNPTKAINDTLDSFWNDQYMGDISRKVHKDAILTGNAYIMLDLVNGETRAYYNPPENVYLEYMDDDPNEKRVGIKLYYSERDDTSRLYLYYPDRIERYEAEGNTSTASNFKLLDEGAHGFDYIPIIQFTAQPELTNVIPLQDAINKTFSDMMVVAEFGAFPQRWMITNADISSLTASPQSIMRIPKGATDEEGTSVGEFGTANLGMYLETIDKLTNSIAIISRTPKHYFMSTGANISGEALTVMETPLVKKVTQLMNGFEKGWLEIADVIAGAPDTVCTWERAETEQVATQAQAMKTMVDMGIPLVTVLKNFGWGEDKIAQMEKDKEEQKAKDATIMDNQIMLALARLEQSNNPYNPASLTQTQAERGMAE